MTEEKNKTEENENLEEENQDLTPEDNALVDADKEEDPESEDPEEDLEDEDEDEDEDEQPHLDGEVPALKLRVSVENTGFRVMPHKTNPEMVILKCCKCDQHKALLGQFTDQMNLNVKNQWKGKNYLITELTRESWVAALQKIAGSEDVFLKLPKSLVPPVPMAPTPTDDAGNPLPQ